MANVITVHSPSDETLLMLDTICKVAKGTVTRFDIALDHHSGNPQAMKSWLVKHAVVKHRPKATRPRSNGDDPPPLMMRDVGDTTYWHNQTNRIKCTRREIVCYADRVSKVTREPCCHFELRIQQADAVRRNGVHKPSDIARLNPAELFARNVTLIDISYHQKERLIRRL